MRREELNDLAVFLAVAEARSFTRAAATLGTSQSAISQIVRRLETSIGLKLLTRNTRNVAPTEAGEQLIATLRPAFNEIDTRLSALSALRERPAGTIRITSSRHAAETVLWPVVSRMLKDYPEVTVEVSIDSHLTDIITDRFDAGIRLGEQVAKDMIAVPIGPELRMAVVGAPAYFAERGRPLTPHELTSHRCINIRMQTKGGLYTWEFGRDGRDLNVRVEGPLILNDVPMILTAAAEGIGLACVMEDQADAFLKAGKLERVLEDWCPPFSGYHLYYPDRRQLPPAFSLLVDALRYRQATRRRQSPVS
ncbi:MULTISPECIES: LysR family transcriptional regulator [unclassified Azospirillum]|uniref:LysR family transcriptional regulator n=1 Tax=unclassified Azospirillum TaxID=2630922 RepID=UPI000B7654A6|nr:MULTISPECIES: LysR family transcriptional regulator [unclassified Azospirillum]SNS90516.1 transcriptional regulator, LysR family [Azospirillum sp. RU38E]SNT07611.1 transcriptional regulator, LysR family [Azospirillum sp. RU37A]